MASSSEGSLLRVGFYEVEATIGRGNYALVKLARHKIVKNEVAIKVIDKTRLDKESLDKMYREIEVLKTVNHPYIVKLYQVMDTKNIIYMVLEYASQGEIYDQIARQKRFREDEARWKFWQIVTAVEYCHHKGIVHRDLKAENLLLDASGRIKLADFGFSNFFAPSGGQLLQTFCGSPPYAAPEVFEGKAYYGPQIDVWSLGVILYVMVCGSMPFEGITIQVLRDRVVSGRYRVPYYMSTECEHLIRRMLTVDPSKRATITQIKNHKWMQKDNMQEKIEHDIRAHQLVRQQDAVQASVRVMVDMGIDEAKIQESIKSDSYDHITGLFNLLMERWRNKNLQEMLQKIVEESKPPKLMHDEHRDSGFGSISEENSIAQSCEEAVIPSPPEPVREEPAKVEPTLPPLPPPSRPRPLLRSLRDHHQFQTTDTVSSYDERLSTVSRQSTIGTIGSIDEGVDSDMSGSCTSGAFGGCTIGSVDSANAFDSFDSQLETDLMNSLACCNKTPDGSQTSHDAPVTQLHASANVYQTTEPSSSTAVQCLFGDGLRASDNTMFNTVQNPFPTGKLNKKAKGVAEINRPSTEGVSSKMEGMKLNPSTKTSPEKRSRQALTFLPKRISLPDHLEFQPQKLLNIKQSIQVEQKMEGRDPNYEGKLLKARINQHNKRQLGKARLRQTKVPSFGLPPVRDEAHGTQLSPIEDSQKEDGMDVA